MKITNVMLRRYIDSNSAHCPVCNAFDTCFVVENGDECNGVIVNRIGCDNCNAAFDEVFVRTRIDNLQHPDDE